MKLSAIALFTAFAAAACIQVPTAYAAECTEAELEMGVGKNTKAGEEAAFYVACPAITEPSGLDVTYLSSFDISALIEINPCQDATCTEYLKGQLLLAPDCEFLGLNVKNASEGVLQVCVGIADGSLTEPQINVIFNGITGNMTISSSSSSSSASGSTTGSTGGSVAGSMVGSMEGSIMDSMAGSMAGSTGSESGSSSMSAGSSSGIDSGSSTVPSPTTSGSSVTTIAGAAVAVSATLASFVLI